jgi:hypothetical protein
MSALDRNTAPIAILNQVKRPLVNYAKTGHTSLESRDFYIVIFEAAIGKG